MGVNRVFADINQTVWIEKERAAAMRVLDTCLSCRFLKSSCGKQQMRDLPAQRVKETSLFRAVGTDFIGPVLVNIGRSQVKCYICICNCLATRAVHLEVVSAVDCDSFLQAYRRLCNRRNVTPRDLCSVNRGAFVAAEKELRSVAWHFNPPRALH